MGPQRRYRFPDSNRDVFEHSEYVDQHELEIERRHLRMDPAPGELPADGELEKDDLFAYVPDAGDAEIRGERAIANVELGFGQQGISRFQYTRPSVGQANESESFQDWSAGGKGIHD